MILRPLEVTLAANERFTEAWPVIEQRQRQKFESCWMITQPSHAALSGDLAARLQAPHVPKLDDALIRSIALHDAGWGPPDAEAIVRSRSKTSEPPRSFLQAELPVFLEAWTQSAEIAQKVCAAGGFMVSRHFTRIAEQRIAHGSDPEAARKKLRTFLAAEARRQKKLMIKQSRTTEELERLTDVLQFCDLLSLYLCSGAQDDVEFPEYFGVKARLRVSGDHYRCVPAVLKSGPPFAIAALRYPHSKAESAREFKITLES